MALAKLRIAVDARSLLCQEPRGEGKSLLRLYDEIVKLRPDIEPVLFGDSATARFSGRLPHGSKLVVMPAISSRWNTWEDILFPVRAKLAGCHVMHCFSSGGPRRTFMPMVMTVHDVIPLVFNDGHDLTARCLFLRRLWHGLRQATHVIAVSNHTRKDLLRLFPECKERVEVVYWGADPVATSLRTGPDDPSVLAFGGEARRKNTDYTIDRFIAAARRVPGLRLRLVGIASARQRQALQRKLAEAGLTERVSMLGFVSEAKLAALIRESTMLLYLSLYEGFGVPLMEAIAHGLPVLASDRTSIPEVLADAPGCYALHDTSSIEDDIVALATSLQSRVNLARAQAKVLPRYNWTAAARRMVELIEAANATPSRQWHDISLAESAITRIEQCAIEEGEQS
jgi:glycosyltransferase involved in cell wall biosynthesis